MRLVIRNPHVQNYGRNVVDVLFLRHPHFKYGYIIDHILRTQPKRVAFYIDGTRSSLNLIGIRFKYFSRTLATIELIWWLLLNRCNPLQFKYIFNITKLDPQQDILFDFTKSTINGYQGNHNRHQIHRFPGIVALHLTHYFTNTKKIARYASLIPHLLYINEGIVEKNPLFKKYLTATSRPYVLPMVAKPRFSRSEKNFFNRANKCFAVGTLFTAKSEEYKEVYGNKPFHPMRQLIFDQADQHGDAIDSLITFFDSKSIKQPQSGDTTAIKLARHYLPAILLNKILPNYKKRYYNFDIVAKYNKYRMFISPEERIGLPSINFPEGMACGCAFIGIDSPMYTDLGLKPHHHYITYQENSLESLIEVINYYQNHPDQLAQIAQRGYRFAQERFTGRVVADTWLADLSAILEKFVQSGTISPRCSFRRSEASPYIPPAKQHQHQRDQHQHHQDIVEHR